MLYEGSRYQDEEGASILTKKVHLAGVQKPPLFVNKNLRALSLFVTLVVACSIQ